MKLRNKKTGEIGTPECSLGLFNVQIIRPDEISNFAYSSLSELNKEWEDYEEPKDSIDYIGLKMEDYNHTTVEIQYQTEEDAEEAVEKLKAWKRLKDKGFKFKSWYGGSKNIDYEITSLENESYIPRQICDDLDLLFGGEE